MPDSWYSKTRTRDGAAKLNAPRPTRGVAVKLKTGYLVVVVAAVCGCERIEISPGVMRPGWRLHGPEASFAVDDWSFADSQRELELEARAPWGWHSVRLWFAVADGRLYVAAYQRKASLRWPRLLKRDPRARVRLEGKLYPVVALTVDDSTTWQAALEAMQLKYRKKLDPYDYPRPNETSVGYVFELRSEAL
jgi:hypothetical protein